MDLTIVHCIENKANHKFERQTKLYLESFKRTNIDLFNQVACVFVQPTANDIEDTMVDYLKSNNVTFIKNPTLSSKQFDNNVNYTNKVITLAHLSTELTTKYMCWLDTDVVFLNNASSLFNDTNKIIVSSFTAGQESNPNFTDSHLFDIKESLPELYFRYFKPYVSTHYQLDSLSHYVNSWFVYGPRENEFWVEWKDLTYELLDIIQKQHPDLLNCGFECFCEELALSILYNKTPNQFENAVDYFNNNTLAMIHTDIDKFALTDTSVLFHYTGVLDKGCSAITGNDYKKDLFSIMSTLLFRKKISNNTFMKLTRHL